MIHKAQFKAYLQLTRLDRPIGIYLVLWPALWALWLAADGMPPISILIIFVLGAVIMRSAGCVINDYADRHFDGYVSRTCTRPLATGLLTERQALKFFLLLCLLAFGLVLFLNPFTIFLSFGAVLLAVLYPFMKRHTFWPQAFLGAAFAWAIPMAFAAIQNDVPWQAWVVFAVTLIWALVYDTAYAIADKEDDLKLGIKSTAILFGQHVRAIIGLFQFLMLLGFIWIGNLFDLSWLYYGSVLIAAMLFLYHQYLLSFNQTQKAFKAFLNNHWVGLVILVGIMLDTL
ncbi:4-hydroxybenzoate octaprenyltransferase [Hydrogenovibrio sp. 3SP14C1]|uniref:4-hydroxybenzoate octaprenyltransferase n=1 Tax=Hydrogenovibrio sp. 3SP14C1 TaxID=3038774 RepID=UPI002416895C|nr:4-hydroxybenzoate octaprenyltransferase [Hydrogenovibrio sp. 3SP14C1]MDG4811551.1 4-hydroxybenzoate octaprenyltransferase [Hydrogenovibrio sp. 3SP14C1]